MKLKRWVICLLGILSCAALQGADVQETRQQVETLAQHNKTTLNVYDNLMKLVTQEFSESDVERICEAICVAAEAHKAQVRKNAEKTPYLSHPLEVAYDLMTTGQVRDVAVIVGGILHDVDQKGLGKQFGSQVAALVKEVRAHPVSAQREHQRDLMIHAADQSLGAAQIELADLLRSLKELSAAPPAHWKKERVDAYFHWAQSVVDRFPEANPPLQEAIKATIQAYWDRQ